MMAQIGFLVRLRPSEDGSSGIENHSARRVGIVGRGELFEFDAIMDASARNGDLLAAVEVLLSREQRSRLIVAVGPKGGGKSHTICSPGGLVEMTALGESGTIRVFEVFEGSVYDLLSDTCARLPGREGRHLHAGLTHLPLSSTPLALALARSRRRKLAGTDCSHVVFVVQGRFCTTMFVDCCGEQSARAAVAGATTAEDYFRAKFRDDDRARDAAASRDLAMLRRVVAFARSGEKTMAAAACRSSTLTYVLRDALVDGSTALILALQPDRRLKMVCLRALELYAPYSSRRPCVTPDAKPLSRSHFLRDSRATKVSDVDAAYARLVAASSDASRLDSSPSATPPLVTPDEGLTANDDDDASCFPPPASSAPRAPSTDSDASRDEPADEPTASSPRAASAAFADGWADVFSSAFDASPFDDDDDDDAMRSPSKPHIFGHSPSASDQDSPRSADDRRRQSPVDHSSEQSAASPESSTSPPAAVKPVYLHRGKTTSSEISEAWLDAVCAIEEAEDDLEEDLEEDLEPIPLPVMARDVPDDEFLLNCGCYR